MDQVLGQAAVTDQELGQAHQPGRVCGEQAGHLVAMTPHRPRGSHALETPEATGRLPPDLTLMAPDGSLATCRDHHSGLATNLWDCIEPSARLLDDESRGMSPPRHTG
ncbi:MAG TPA: hypothetical protein VG276_20255, partial [Actinomycetes bacterium]|nr:hypothetical protein [Actinomycetes bacterium]